METETKQAEKVTTTEHIFDLIYNDEAKGDFRKLFPEAVIEDASDDIHEGRFSVEMKEFQGTKVDYLEKICENGLHNISLMFGVMVRTDKPLAEELLQRLKKKGLIKDE